MKRFAALAMTFILNNAAFAGEALPGAEDLLLNSHPLAETIWDVAAGEQISREELMSRVLSKDHVLLGERHDNPRHHRIQAEVMAALGEAGSRRTVVFEMAEPEHREVLAAAEKATVDELGTALRWSERGWPDWKIYQVIAEVALTYDFHMVPGGPSRDLLKAVGQGSDLPKEMADELRWQQDYRPDQLQSLEQELVDAHCGILGRESVAPLVPMQRLKDAFMGMLMRRAVDDGQGSVLIAGNGHIRLDRGVPYYLDDTSSRIAIAPVEVQRDLENPQDYASFDPKVYDYIWFTGRVDEVDPCVKFKDQLERMKQSHGTATTSE
ncbi:ChaN family lipoprotein [Pseudovibrio exalbescens]|uniref:ChaN family lipoprotein n=1 Tax=Pseudovibrio exalbescens TaxID=197461 RepID=UPI002365C8D3|nr:ChaN family lipoprotein [Pseudovibrio exalbescens]MDD7910957.1 ChaN family lipoprotein [Pseudovibrio exalbescens]